MCQTVNWEKHSLSGSLGSFVCFLRYFSGDGASTLAGPIVLIEALVSLFSRTTVGRNLDMYLQRQKTRMNILRQKGQINTGLASDIHSLEDWVNESASYGIFIPCAPYVKQLHSHVSLLQYCLHSLLVFYSTIFALLKPQWSFNF